MESYMYLNVTFKQVNARHIAHTCKQNYILYQNCWRWNFLIRNTCPCTVRPSVIYKSSVYNDLCIEKQAFVGKLWPAQSVKRTRYTLELSLLKRRNVVFGNSLYQWVNIHVKCLSNNKTCSSNVTKCNYAIHRINIIEGKWILYTYTYCLLNYNFFNNMVQY